MSEIASSSEQTRIHNAEVGSSLSLDPSDFDRASRGLLLAAPQQINSPHGFASWDLDQYAFCHSDCPDTVNPSLWRQSQLNLNAGLFEVCDGIYQARGMDLSNITFVRGETGWIVIDPLSAAETAAAAVELVDQQFGKRPIKAVIYTHSHVDHFAGVRGVISSEEVETGEVDVIAPAGFLHAAISENIYAGPAMVRRAMYMYGPLLPKGPTGQVDAGLGKGIPVLGSTGLIAPTIDITSTGQELTIDGVRIVFQMTPDTEAPAEMNFYFPDFRALCMAENCCGTMHNLYTPRGAQIRDSLSWSKYIDEALTLFGDRSDTLFASHHWPRFGTADAISFLEIQRDLYRFMHDQTLRLANHGLVASEIAEVLTLPAPFEREASTRGYYGTLSHNTKAVYQRYLGWFDGNPAHLNPLPPAEAGALYVEVAGGAEALIHKARDLFDAGQYRFASELLNHLVFSDPTNTEAKLLQAESLEQMGFQAESAVWRNFYLQGAKELREGVLPFGRIPLSNPDVARAMTLEMLLDLVGIRLNADRLDEDGPAQPLAITIRCTDSDERRTIWVRNFAVHHRLETPNDSPDVVITAPRPVVSALCTGDIMPDQLGDDGQVTVDGDSEALAALWTCLDTFEVGWGIVTP